jgi:hypothetical protein
VIKSLCCVILIFLASFGAGVQAQTTPTKPLYGPKLKFTEKSHDFGSIAEGIKVSHDFEFTNTGDTNLLLVNVQASCGCTVPSWPKQPIKPGEKAKITVVYNSARRAGENFHQSITVTTNMQKDYVFVIYIKGKVEFKSEPIQQQPVPINSN